MSSHTPYDIILDDILRNMAKFGIVSSIAISIDIFEKMNTKEINHLESLMNGDFKWLISNEKKNYYKLIFSFQPLGYIDDI
jgi:hypothetical protein